MKTREQREIKHIDKQNIDKFGLHARDYYRRGVPNPIEQE